jgi:dTDP-4-amino-4,6-dideoxygalactose transaminase
VDNTCNKRFGWQLGDFPFGYDHKYTYSHVGYNLKMTDMQAAVGVAQLDKLPEFIQKRRENFDFLHQKLRFFGLSYATYRIIRNETLIEKDIWRFLSIVFDLERTNQLNLLPDKDLVDLCPPIEPYQVTKN